MGAVTAQSSLCGPREEKGVLDGVSIAGGHSSCPRSQSPGPVKAGRFCAGCDSSIKVRAESRGESRPCGGQSPGRPHRVEGWPGVGCENLVTVAY